MMNHKRTWIGTSMLMTAVGACGMLVSGCGSEPERQAVQQPAPPPTLPPTPTPTARPVADLMAELRIDERVHLPEERAPQTTEERRAVLEFFDAFARSDADLAGRMMTDLDERELQKLVESGDWEKVTSNVRRIDIQTGDSEFGQCALALYDVGTGFQAQLWYYSGSGDEFTFEAAPTPPDIVNRLSGTDWIAAWHDILAEEQALAMKPDETFRFQQNLDTGESAPDTPSSGPSGPTGPIQVPTGPAPGGPSPPNRKPPGNPQFPGG